MMSRLESRMLHRRPLAPAVLLTAFLGAAPALAAPCREDSYEGHDYILCSVDLSVADLRLFWRNGDGEAYRTFPALAKALEGRGLRLEFAMNGGMYQADYSPVGIHIEGGRELAPANTKPPPAGVSPAPNFYKLPNGIFYAGPRGAGVMETARFLKERPAADIATQSGPMLVIDGKLHPALIDGSTDRNRRNGVGVSSPGMVHFVISEDDVNFHDFASYFRDRLGCANALFLDGGSAPGIHAPSLDRSDRPGHGGYGPILGVVTSTR